MKIHQILLGLLPIFTACAGYYGRAFRQDEVRSLATSDIPGLDYFITQESFSEIENAKALLQGLSIRFLTESRDKRFSATTNRASHLRDNPSANNSHFAEIATELERVTQEFKGTEQQLTVVQDLLWVLKQQRRFDRWLDVYLDLLYQHPTHPMIGRTAGEALEMARHARREPEVVMALKHLAAIPLDFEGKGLVEKLIGNVSASPSPKSIARPATPLPVRKFHTDTSLCGG